MNAVASANTNKESVKISEVGDGSDVDPSQYWVTQEVMANYEAAIAAAQAVIDKADATQEEVDQALSDLEEATVTFVASKQHGTYDETKAYVYDQAELEAALEKEEVTNIYFTNDITTNKQILVTKANKVILGQGKTLFAAEGMTYQEPNKSVLTVINANGVKISNLTVDADAANTNEKDHGWDGVYAIQVYVSENVTLDGVTLKNGDAGLLVNGSTVTVNNITTSRNQFGGIEVSQGEGVTSKATLEVTGTSSHDVEEPVYIWTIGTNAEVLDSEKQYISGADIREGKEGYVNFILEADERPVPYTKEAVKEAIKPEFSVALGNAVVVTVDAEDNLIVGDLTLPYGFDMLVKERLLTKEEVQEKTLYATGVTLKVNTDSERKVRVEVSNNAEGVTYYMYDSNGGEFTNTNVWGPKTGFLVNSDEYKEGVTTPVFFTLEAEPGEDLALTFTVKLVDAEEDWQDVSYGEQPLTVIVPKTESGDGSGQGDE
jgi:hypothetical protein